MVNYFLVFYRGEKVVYFEVAGNSQVQWLVGRFIHGLIVHRTVCITLNNLHGFDRCNLRLLGSRADNSSRSLLTALSHAIINLFGLSEDTRQRGSFLRRRQILLVC